MKKTYDCDNTDEKMRKGVIASGAAVLISALVLLCAAGCSQTAGNTSSSASEGSVRADVSAVSDASADNGESESSDEGSEKESSVEAAESSVQESSAEEKGSAVSEDESEKSEEEGSENEESVIGYQFDDEQIVEDYHTATVFTANDGFNELFKDNKLDKEYTSKLQDASTITEMRMTTIYYAEQWEEKTNDVYAKLCKKLSDNKEALAQLTESQESWSNSLGQVEESFTEEARDGGTEGLLAADSAMLYYYKGRTASLLCSVYEADPESFELSDYGL